MKKTIFFIMLAGLLISLLAPSSGLAFQSQPEESISLSVSKVVGYASGIGKAQREMQGTFTVTARGPESLTRVIFYLDEQVIGEVNQTPFRLTFDTAHYPLGSHIFRAVGYTAEGREISSDTVSGTFVTPSAGMASAIKIIVPLFVVIFGGTALFGALSMLSSRGKKPAAAGTQYDYGIRGGAICPKCKRPFPRAIFGINLGPLHRLERCPHCGKWAPMGRRSVEELRAAEQAELASQQVPSTELTEEERLRRDLEASRYQ
jgi:hypothetical protein